jgi:hypothetical protein
VILCLTGMHRSGTSALAGWFETRGLPMVGRRSLGAAVGNESGHREDAVFYQVTAGAIRRAHPGSDGWRLSTPEPAAVRLCAAESLRAVRHGRARRHRARTEHGTASWGWKDPRVSLCVDSYLRIFPRLHVLALWRPASLVVDSLLRRAERAAAEEPGGAGDLDIDAETATITWLGYNHALLRARTRHPRRVLIVSLEGLLALPSAPTDELLARYGLAPGVPAADTIDPTRIVRHLAAGSGLGGSAVAARARQVQRVEAELRQVSLL